MTDAEKELERLGYKLDYETDDPWCKRKNYKFYQDTITFEKYKNETEWKVDVSSFDPDVDEWGQPARFNIELAEAIIHRFEELNGACNEQ